MQPDRTIDLTRQPAGDTGRVLACPECGVALVRGDTSFHCAQCGVSYPSAGGLVRIHPAPYYWGEIPRASMLTTLERARQFSWREAVLAAGNENNWLNAEWNVCAAARADWFPEVSLRKGMRALDVGSGWGNIAFLLSEFIDEVYSLEGVIERADFQQIRREQDHVRNLTVVNADLIALPFLTQSFDLVVLNGVLEWVGLADLERAPRDVQLAVLRRIRGLLKPGGCLYIGIENRLGLAVFQGETDHSGLPYTSLLPRCLADLVVRIHGRSHYRTQGLACHGYRTYTYTPRGYRKLLQEAGFPNVSVSWVLPGYNLPLEGARFENRAALRFLAASQGRGSLRKRVKGLLLRAATACGLQEGLLHHVSVVARTDGNRAPTLLETICLGLRDRGIGVRAQDALRYTSLHRALDRRGRILYVLFDEKTLQPAVVVKIPRTRASSDVMRHEISAYTQITAHNQELAAHRRAIYMDVAGIPILCERFFRGQPLTEHPMSEPVCLAVLDWLAGFQKCGPHGTNAISTAETGDAAINRLSAHASVDRGVIVFLRDWLDAITNTEDSRTQAVPVHGDFTPCNILLSGDEFFVTDWECAECEGAPWEDFWAFIMSWGLNTTPDGATGTREADNLLALLTGESVHSSLVRNAAASFSEAAGVLRHTLWGGLLPAITLRALRGLEAREDGCDGSVYYRVLLALARSRLPLWERVESILNGGVRHDSLPGTSRPCG